MDGLSLAASVIAVIQLTGAIVKMCGGYIQEVKEARDDIISLQRTLKDFEAVVHKLKQLLEEPRCTKLFTSSLADSISGCVACLEAVEKKIDPGKRERIMKRLGLRALRWPFKRDEVNEIITKLERYKSTFTLSLQLDQTTLLTDVAQKTDEIDQNLGLDKLPIVHGAQFDSYMNQHEDECLSGTRTELLGQISEWATSPQGKCIFWLSGKAGTGKSTICRTVARSLSEDKLLGASFFFKRGEGDRGNATKLFPTVAQQLLIRMPMLRRSVLKAVGDEPDLAGKSLKEQFDKLLLHPLLSLDLAPGQVPIIVIVIDALDECDNDKDIRIILQLIPQLRASTAVRMRVFLTSREETPIMLGFTEIGNHHENLALHNVPEAVTEHDITLFLKDRFAKIRDERKIPPDWPGDETFQALVMLSVPLFISAATVCRFLDDSRWDPKLRLEELLQNQAKYATKMERTYLPILTQLLKDQDDDESQQLLQQFQRIVGVIILLAVPLSVNSLSKLLQTRVEAISNLLNSFQSVFHISANQDLPVRILHLSFRDFLVQHRGEFRVDEQQTHKTITKYCLAVMRDGLKRNICHQSSYGTRRKDVDAQSIQQYLPPELQYSCRYWAHHLAQCTISAAEMHHALLFLQKHFLHWIEAMCILGLASDVVKIIKLLQLLLDVQRDENHELSEFLYDARRFFLKNRQIFDDAPLQIYYAGLLFAPETALIRREFTRELPNWIRVSSNVQNTWTGELQTLEGHSGFVHSVAFSYDTLLPATGSEDSTVKLWDAATGALEQTLEGHSSRVLSVAFSCNSQLLASGSHDNTVRLWDTATGVSRITLDGHSSSVQSVAFSHDGGLVVTGSYDCTVRLWDVATGALEQILQCHPYLIFSVALSHRLLATGSGDKTVRLWDTATGSLWQTFKGHSRMVRSVAFSNDNRLLATGSDDHTIKLWDVVGGSLQHTLKGHKESVNSVAFSPDGRLLATGSGDETVRLWDASTGVLQQTLSGSFGLVSSVVFSYDGRLLAIGLYDKTIRLWNISGALQSRPKSYGYAILSVAISHSGRLLAISSTKNIVSLWDTATVSLQQTLKGHSGSIGPVIFSRDDQLLATCSDYHTVGLWDTVTGALQQTLKGHSGCVFSAAFSPDDGRLLATGAADNTARIWDTVTGCLRQALKGHVGGVRSVALSHDGQLLATGSGDNMVRLWDVFRGSLQWTLDFGDCLDLVQAIAFSHDDQLLATSSSGNTIKLLDVATGVRKQTLHIKGRVTDLEFAEDKVCLMTNRGYVNTQNPYGDDTSGSPKLRAIRFLVKGDWVTFDGERVLWLPLEYRLSRSSVRGDAIALVHSSDQITMIEFGLYNTQ